MSKESQNPKKAGYCDIPGGEKYLRLRFEIWNSFGL
jgi:hypothetical protein